MDITHYLKTGYLSLCITTVKPQRAIVSIEPCIEKGPMTQKEVNEYVEYPDTGKIG